jgi:hypothetical protein
MRKESYLVEIEPSPTEVGFEQLGFVGLAGKCFMDIFVELLRVVGWSVCHPTPLGGAPNVLHRVEFWGVRWQMFEVCPAAVVLFENRFRFAMSTQVIPHDPHLAFDFLMQIFQKPRKVFCLGIMIQQLKIHVHTSSPWRKNQCRDSAESVMTVPMLDHRCLALLRPASSHQRLKHEARFIDKNNASFVMSPLFLSVATLSLATLVPRLSLALCFAAGVSGKRSPESAAGDLNAPDCRQRRTLARPVPQSAPSSTGRPCIPTCVGRRATAARVGCIRLWITGTAERAVVWRPTLWRGHPACQPSASTYSPIADWRRPPGRHPSSANPRTTVSRPAADGPPTIRRCL